MRTLRTMTGFSVDPRRSRVRRPFGTSASAPAEPPIERGPETTRLIDFEDVAFDTLRAKELAKVTALRSSATEGSGKSDLPSPPRAVPCSETSMRSGRSLSGECRQRFTALGIDGSQPQPVEAVRSEDCRKRGRAPRKQ